MISTVIITVSFAKKLFYLTRLHSSIGCYFDYLPLFTLQVCGVYLTSFKDFKAFWPGSFTYPPVKVTDAFCKVWGLIEIFN